MFDFVNIETNKIPQLTKVTKTVEVTKSEHYKSSTTDANMVPKTFTNIEHHEIEGNDLSEYINKGFSQREERMDAGHKNALKQLVFDDLWQHETKTVDDDLETTSSVFHKFPTKVIERAGDVRQQNFDSNLDTFKLDSSEFGGKKFTSESPTNDDNQFEELMIKPEVVGEETNLMSGEEVLQQEIERTLKVHEVETMDEITIETKVQQVKTIHMQLSEVGDISVSETTEIKTDTDMKETKKTKERDELIMSHKMLDRPSADGLGRQAPSPLFSSSVPVSSEYTVRSSQSPFDEARTESSLAETVITNVFPQTEEVFSEVPSYFSNPIHFVTDYDPSLFIALSSYEPESDEVMSLHEGEMIKVLDQRQEDWWLVQKMFDSRQGFVPSHYLREKSEFDRSVEQQISNYISKIPSESSKPGSLTSVTCISSEL